MTQTNPTGERLSPSETALALRKRFKCIFVDEYQDINPVQQSILDALSSGNNVFVVGDVKQSIYAWRGAEPTIFLERLRPASPSPKDPSCGFRVDLNYNFRSARGILDFVNKIFGRIMTAEIANVNYDETARLQAPPDSQHRPTAAGRSWRCTFSTNALPGGAQTRAATTVRNPRTWPWSTPGSVRRP